MAGFGFAGVVGRAGFAGVRGLLGFGLGLPTGVRYLALTQRGRPRQITSAIPLALRPVTLKMVPEGASPSVPKWLVNDVRIMRAVVPRACPTTGRTTGLAGVLGLVGVAGCAGFVGVLCFAGLVGVGFAGVLGFAGLAGVRGLACLFGFVDFPGVLGLVVLPGLIGELCLAGRWALTDVRYLALTQRGRPCQITSARPLAVRPVTSKMVPMGASPSEPKWLV
mgnify:FL=1